MDQPRNMFREEFVPEQQLIVLSKKLKNNIELNVHIEDRVQKFSGNI